MSIFPKACYDDNIPPEQKSEHIEDEEEARKRRFPKGSSFKLLKRDLVLLRGTMATHSVAQTSKRAHVSHSWLCFEL